MNSWSVKRVDNILKDSNKNFSMQDGWDVDAKNQDCLIVLGSL